MQRKKIVFDYVIYMGLEELPQTDRHLMEEAITAREQAYAPYSGFKVGAAILLENDQIVLGNNQENASYPSGLCAERVAVYQAGARFPGLTIRAIAISSASEHLDVNKPAAPCGNCRQAIAEYENRQLEGIRILMMGATGPVYQCHSIADLLPLAFGRSNLE